MEAIARFVGEACTAEQAAHLRAAGRLAGVDVDKHARRDYNVTAVEELRADVVREWTEALRRKRRAA